MNSMHSSYPIWIPNTQYWVTQKLPQMCTVILRICIGKVAGFVVHICGNFWVTNVKFSFLLFLFVPGSQGSQKSKIFLIISKNYLKYRVVKKSLIKAKKYFALGVSNFQTKILIFEYFKKISSEMETVMETYGLPLVVLSATLQQKKD